MPAITYEIGGKNSKLRESLKDSKTMVRDFRQNIAALNKQMHADAKQVGGGKGIFGQVLGGNLAAQGVGLLVGKVRDVANAMGELQDASEQFGVAAGDLDKLQKAQQGSGVTVENLRKSLLNLNEARSKALAGDSASQNQFADLGISAEKLKSLDLIGLYLGVADGLSMIEDKGIAASKAFGLMGVKGAKQLDALLKGGAELRAEMDRQTGALTSEAIAKTDSAMDQLTNKVSNKAGEIIQKIIDIPKSFADAMNEVNLLFGGSGTVQSTPEPPAPSPAALAASKKAEEEKRAAFEQERAAAKKAITDKEAADKAEIARKKELADSLDRVADSERERVNIVRSAFTLTEKYEKARTEVLKAQKAYDDAQVGDDKTMRGREKQAADLAEAKNKFLEIKKDISERAGLPLAEQDRLREQDKATARQRRQAERTLNAKERDRLDRAFRQGKISQQDRDNGFGALAAWKPDPSNEKAIKETAANTKAAAEEAKKLNQKLEKL